MIAETIDEAKNKGAMEASKLGHKLGEWREYLPGRFSTKCSSCGKRVSLLTGMIVGGEDFGSEFKTNETTEEPGHIVVQGPALTDGCLN